MAQGHPCHKLLHPSPLVVRPLHSWVSQPEAASPAPSLTDRQSYWYLVSVGGALWPYASMASAALQRLAAAHPLRVRHLCR